MAIGTVRLPVPVCGSGPNVSPMPRRAPPPCGSEMSSSGDCVASPICAPPSTRPGGGPGRVADGEDDVVAAPPHDVRGEPGPDRRKLLDLLRVIVGRA